jgi:hypothetical protein
MPLPSLGDPPPIRLANQSAMNSEWRDPEDTLPSAARTARTVTGYRGYDPLRRCLARHGDRCGISERHVLAADRLRTFADGAAIGFSPPRDGNLLSANGRAGGRGGEASEVLEGFRPYYGDLHPGPT